MTDSLARPSELDLQAEREIRPGRQKLAEDRISAISYKIDSLYSPYPIS